MTRPAGFIQVNINALRALAPPRLRPRPQAIRPPSPPRRSPAGAAGTEVDAETGEVTIVRYVVGHDCGNVINPLIVEGQILGGVAHGLSNALYEEAIYDDQGQSLATSFLDYPIPTAREMPRVEMFHLTTPSPINPLRVKGAGEAGTLPVTAAVPGAVEDALRPFSVRVNRMPLNPARIVELIRGR